MENRPKTCCFTGHRPERLPWLSNPADVKYLSLRRALWDRIQVCCDQGYTRFLTGMAQGVDLLCAELVLELREEIPQIELVPVLPYPGQAARWPAEDRRRHKDILKVCSEQIVVVSPEYDRGCFYRRNRYLVDHSDRIIGVYDGVPSGGTHQTLEYAKQKNVEMMLMLAES